MIDENPNNWRKCKACGEWKHLDEFTARSKYKCQICHDEERNQYSKQRYYKKVRPERMARNRRMMEEMDCAGSLNRFNWQNKGLHHP